eukprot:5117158-Alexandrium_andersonii.AAC.1
MTLYYKLKGKAWDDAEDIDVEKLRQEDTALEYFEEWIRKRYFDMEITKVGKVLQSFFRGTRKRHDQDLRDCNGVFDRQ